MVSLLVEVNSIFLHWRQLLLLCSTPKSSNYFRYVSLANLGTFLVFRIVNLGWMTRWLILNHDKLHQVVYTMGSLALTCVMIMSTVLFFRLLRSDHFQTSAYSSSSSRGKSSKEEIKIKASWSQVTIRACPMQIHVTCSIINRMAGHNMKCYIMYYPILSTLFPNVSSIT
jgi:hypothetical protein